MHQHYLLLVTFQVSEIVIINYVSHLKALLLQLSFFHLLSSENPRHLSCKLSTNYYVASLLTPGNSCLSSSLSSPMMMTPLVTPGSNLHLPQFFSTIHYCPGILPQTVYMDFILYFRLLNAYRLCFSLFTLIFKVILVLCGS